MTEPLLLVVQHQDDCPPAWIGRWLEEAGCRLDVRHPYAGDALPDDLSGHDGYLVLGGSMGAHDDDPTRGWRRRRRWCATPRRDVRRPWASASATSWWLPPSVGSHDPNPLGQQLGLLGLGWTDAAGQDDLFRGVAGEYGVFWNDDVVVRAPAGTVALARTPGGELQVARFAPTVWGVQLHPEVDEQVLERWAEDDRDRYDEGVLESVLARVAEHRADLAAGWRPLADAFASRVSHNP